MRRYDLVVIGGGTAGLVSALIGARAGANVALIERERTGGDCLWTGCVPSKSLIASATLAHRMRTAESVGLEPVEPRVDFARVMAHVRGAQARIAPEDSPERLRREGVDVIEAEARFAGSGWIEAGGSRLGYRRAIVATGSRPVVPPVPGLADASPLTTDTVWHLNELPMRMVVLGGGPVGCELSQALARLGAAVALVEMAPRLLPREEPRASAVVEQALRGDGVAVRTGVAATEVVRLDGGLALVLESGERLEADRIVAATARRPVTDGLGLDVVGARTDASRALVVDDRLRTTARGVYGAGDVTGALPFTHVAAYHARVAVANALFGGRRRVSYRAVPWVTFTDPEVGRVGMSEQEARDAFGTRVRIVEHDYSHLDRAITAGEPYGFAKLVCDARGRLVGATVAAPAGGESIAELAAWIDRRAKIDDVSRIVHAYPTFTEGQARAADEYAWARLRHPATRVAARAALALGRILERPR